MRLFGDLSELSSVQWRTANGKVSILDALESTESSVTYNLPALGVADTSAELAVLDVEQTFKLKIIDADNNTISNLEVDNLKQNVLNVSATLAGASDAQLPSALAVKTYIIDSLAAQDDASEITYTPSTLADWSGAVDPGNVDDGLDQLASRLSTAESDISTNTSGISTNGTNISNHISSTTAHTAANLVNVPSGNLVATDVQAALNELQTDVDTRALNSDLTAHEGQVTGAHEATAVIFNPTGNSLTGINVQTALVEAVGRLDTAETNISNNDTDISNLQSDKLNRDGTQAMTGSLNMGGFDIGSVGTVDGVDVSAFSFNFNTHTASTSAHGVSGAVVGTSDTQTLLNKTLTKPLIAAARLDSVDIVSITSNNLGAISNAVIFRITGGDTTLSTISTTDANRWIVIVNDSGVELTIQNNSGALGIITGTEADLFLAPDAALTLTYNSTAQRWNIVGGAGSGGGLTTEFVAADVNSAASDTHYLVDCSTASRTITLPASPRAGSVIRVSDESGDAGTNDIVIAGNGQTVDGDSSFIIDVNNGWAQLSWTGSDWTVDTLAVNDGAGLLSLNGLTTTSAPTQTFATGAAGTDFGISSSGSTHTFNIPDASASARGLVTADTQTIAGAKTFSSLLSATAGANITGGNVGIGTASPLAKLQTNTYAQYDYVAGTDERLAAFAPTVTGAASSAQVILGNAIYGTGGTENLRLSFLNNHNNGSQHTGWALHSYNNLAPASPTATFSLESIKRPALNTEPPIRTPVLQVASSGAVTLGPSGGVGSVSVPNNTPTTLIDVGSTEYQNRQIWLVVYDTGTNVGAAAFIYVNFQGAVYTPTINQTFTGTNTSLLSVSGTQIRFTQTFGSTRTIRYRMVAL